MRMVSTNLYVTVRDNETDSVIKMVTTDTGDIILEFTGKATFKMDRLQEGLNNMKEFLRDRRMLEQAEERANDPTPFFQVEHLENNCE